MPLQDLRPEHRGCKVRVAGCLAAYDASCAMGVLSHGAAILLVDLSLCVQGASFLHKPMLMIVGDLEGDEEAKQEVRNSSLEELVPDTDTALLLRARLVRSCEGLDFQKWDLAARTESLARLSSDAERTAD
ncbi:unnamed protein product [Parajaminaea phylloscopi]